MLIDTHSRFFYSLYTIGNEAMVQFNNSFSGMEHFDIIRLSISLELNSTSGKISPFALGNMDIAMGNVSLTSRGKNPDQSFMMLSSLTDLFGGLYRLRSDIKNSSYFFVGDSSSFAIVFRLLPGNILHLKYGNVIMEMPFNRFSEELIRETKRILNEYAGRFADKDGIILDLADSIDRLKGVVSEKPN